MSGFGLQPFGLTPYGVGTPADMPEAGGAILRDTSTDSSTGSRRIDPVTHDYVIDANGRTLGMNNTRQLVFLALSTRRGSSIVQRLGHRLDTIAVVTPDIDRLIATEIRGALADLVNARRIEIVSIQTDVVRPGAVTTVVRWRDAATREEQKTAI